MEGGVESKGENELDKRYAQRRDEVREGMLGVGKHKWPATWYQYAKWVTRGGSICGRGWVTSGKGEGAISSGVDEGGLLGAGEGWEGGADGGKGE